MAKRTTPKKNSGEVRQIDAGIVVCSINLADFNEGNSQRIHLIPVDENGMIVGLDGRTWKYNAENILASAAKAKIDFAGDYHHASLKAADTGADAPACGWIDPASISAEANGIWGDVEWTDKAAAAIRAKEYKYISPVFAVNKSTGETLALKGFALTHYPNLGDLTPVANAQNLEDKQMDELLERIKYLLNLPELAEPEEIIAELEKAIARLRASLGSDVSEAANAQDTNLIDLLTQLESHITELAENSRQDLTGYVPREEFERVRTELNSITTERENARVETAVNAALDAGVISPASKEWAENYCRKDAEGFAQFVANGQKVVPLGEDEHGKHAGSDILSEEEMAICSQLGISHEDFIKSKTGQEE